MHTLHSILPAAAGLVVLLICPCCPSEAPGAEKAGTEQALSVRQRLQRAIDVTRKLHDKARHPTKAEIGQRQLKPVLLSASARGDIVPRGAFVGERIPDKWSAAELRCSLRVEVVCYEQVRPWTARYSAMGWVAPCWAGIPKWPGPTDAPQLRELLGDDDPAIRCMAVEALATLYLPEDIPRIARLLDDESEGLPVRGWNRNLSSVPTVSFAAPRPDELEVMRGWHAQKVEDYAWLALRLVTGENLTPASFVPWWERNRNARHRLWYWQQRLRDEICEAEALSHPPYWSGMDREMIARLTAERARKIEARKDAVRRKAAEELRRLPAEVDAKVRLLALDFGDRVPEFFYSDAVWRKLGPLRLSPERLLDLLDRKDLWDDVDWRCNSDGDGPYDRLVERLMLAAPDVFGPEHVDRLRAVLAREGDKLPESGGAALLIGISRLLPPAAPGNLDDPQTRDGTLRAAVRKGSRDATGELIRVGLTQNWPFLKEQFFAGSKRPVPPTIEMLGTPPLTDAKRTALRELLFDERFEPLWKTDAWCRAYALQAVNAHAGKEVFPQPFPKELNDQTLPEVLRKAANALK